MWNRIVKILFAISAVVVPGVAHAKCEINADNLYEQFKSYREQINTAARLEDLTIYFSQNFNQYFTDKVTHSRGKISKQRYLNQYWDNLNTAKDVVIVFDYTMQCDSTKTSLVLTAILNTNQSNEGQEVDLWNVTINYTKDDPDWKIDSFEYKKLGSRKNYLATEIKNNFVIIR